MNDVFADTFYYLALINKNDAAHGPAVAFSHLSRPASRSCSRRMLRMAGGGHSQADAKPSMSPAFSATEDPLNRSYNSRNSAERPKKDHSGNISGALGSHFNSKSADRRVLSATTWHSYAGPGHRPGRRSCRSTRRPNGATLICDLDVRPDLWGLISILVVHPPRPLAWADIGSSRWDCNGIGFR